MAVGLHSPLLLCPERQIGGHIDYDDNHDEIFNFISTKGTFSYNERTDEFKRKLQIR